MNNQKPLLKNFSFISSGLALNNYTWDCPDLIGYYEATIHSVSTSNTEINHMAILNSPQIVNASYKNSTVGPIINEGGNTFPISVSNYIILGTPQDFSIMFKILKVIMLFNGKFYQEFLKSLFGFGNSLYRSAYTYYSIVMSFKPYNQHPEYKIGVNPVIRNQNRQLITIYEPSNVSYVNKDIGLWGKFRVTPVFGFCTSSFPENVGLSVYSSQLSTTIPNDKRFYLQLSAIGLYRGQIYYNYPALEGEFNGYFDMRFYSVQNNTEEAILPVFFQFMFERIG